MFIYLKAVLNIAIVKAIKYEFILNLKKLKNLLQFMIFYAIMNMHRNGETGKSENIS